MLSPLSDVATNITMAHCDAVGRGHPLHQFSVAINRKLFFRESAKVLETQNGWGRVTRAYDASCSAGKSQYVDSGRAVCDKANGIIDGKFAEWIKLDGLSKERPAPAKAGNSAIEQALKDSDQYEEHKDRFIAATEELMTSGQCKLRDFIDQGGWVRSTQKSRGVGIYCNRPIVTVENMS